MDAEQKLEWKLHISEAKKRQFQSPEGIALRERLSASHRGKKQPLMVGIFHSHWKGDRVGYASLHEWIRAWKPKPALCERCHQRPPREVHNISGELRRDLADFIWLCSKCHHEIDGRTEKARERLRELAELRIGTHRALT